MLINCTECKTEISDKAKKCPKCGAPPLRWIEKQTDFDRVYGMWNEFRNSAIDGIGGMTMNERLYRFGLFDLFENAKDDAEKDKYYQKLMAKK